MKLTSRNNSLYRHRAEEENFNFKSVILKYAGHKSFFVWTICTAILFVFIVNQSTPPVYKIQSKFLIKEESNPMNLIDFSGTGSKEMQPRGQKIANAMISLKSREIAARALDQLQFDVEYYKNGLFINPEIYKNSPIIVETDWNHAQLINGEIEISWTNNSSYELDFLQSEYEKYTPGEVVHFTAEEPDLHQPNFRFGEWVVFTHGKFRVSLVSDERQGSTIIKLRDRESLLRQFTGDHLQIVSADKTSSILLLTLDTHHPVKGTDFLNALMNVFLDSELEEKNTIARNTIRFIDKQLAGISDSLTYSGTKLEKFRSDNRTYNITAEANTVFQKLSELEKSLSQEKFKRDYYLTLQDYLIKENYSEIIIPAGLGIDDPVLNKLIEDLIRYQSDKSRYLATQTENSPTVREASRKIKDISESIKEALKNVNHNSNWLISDLQKRIYRIENQFGKLPETEQNLLNIKRKYTLNENIYNFLLQRRAEADIALASNTASNKIIDSAVSDFEPLRLRPLLNYVLAILFGFIFPVGVISLREAFSMKIEDLKEVEEKLKVPVVGCIGKNKKYHPQVVFDRPRSGITEAFRALRTSIDFVLQKDGQITILITSTIASEGKSFCGMNLASVYSALGKKTVIVECDMHKPFSLDGFQISNAKGLSNYLGDLTMQTHDVVQPTQYANLDVLAPGQIPPNPADLLISDRFKQLIRQLKQSYDVIILDSSPVGLTNETLYLTRLADLTLFMLRQHFTGKTSIDYLNSLHEKKGIRNLYAVINDVEDKCLSYQGYGFGYYDDDADLNPRKENMLKMLIRRGLGKAAI